MRKSFSGQVFDYCNHIFLILFAILTVLPFLYVLAGSLAAPEIWYRNDFVLFPTKFSFEGYQYIFSSAILPRSLITTIVITVVGTFVNVLMTSLMAYPLAQRELDGRNAIMFLVLFSMLFSGGMIPTYLIVKYVGLLNTYWSLIVPGAISAFNLIITKNFFQRLEEGLIESARIDGCHELGILFRIVMPLSTPILATFTLFYAVGHWNTFFSAILYINDAYKWPVQVWLRQIVILSQGGLHDNEYLYDNVVPPPEIVKMAVIVVTTAPIMLVYPFLQKYFAKGLLLGSVKG